MHAKAGALTKVVSAALASSRCSTATTTTTITGVHLSTPTKDGTPDAHLQRMELQMHTYMCHLAYQQTTNHRGQMQLNENFYHYTLHQHCQDPNPYLWLTHSNL